MPHTLRTYISGVLFLWMLFWAGPALAKDTITLSPWHILRTRHTTIKFKSFEDLERFHKSVKFGKPHWNLTPALAGNDQKALVQMVTLKVDAIFVRAQEILDMKKRFAPVNVHIYPDKPALKRAYESIYPGRCRLRAWYRFKTNTVYMNAKDVHAGMLAHELAHAIIDHFLTVKPPPQTAEILARYVDSHLTRGFVN